MELSRVSLKDCKKLSYAHLKLKLPSSNSSPPALNLPALVIRLSGSNLEHCNSTSGGILPKRIPFSISRTCLLKLIILEAAHAVQPCSRDTFLR